MRWAFFSLYPGSQKIPLIFHEINIHKFIALKKIFDLHFFLLTDRFVLFYDFVYRQVEIQVFPVNLLTQADFREKFK